MRALSSSEHELLFTMDDVRPHRALPSRQHAMRASSSHPDMSQRSQAAPVVPVMAGLEAALVHKSRGALSAAQANQLLEELVHRIFSGRQHPDVEAEDVALEVAEMLAEAGFHCHVVCESGRIGQATNMPVMPFRPFILVTGCTWGKVSSETTSLSSIVDFDFRSKFSIHAPSPGYAHAFGLLPSVFVGPDHTLENVVTRMAELLKREFQAKEHALPPWRSQASLLGIWFPHEGRRSLEFSA